MTGSRLILAILVVIGFAYLPSHVNAGGEGIGLFHRKPKIDPARVRQLVDIARNDPDEKKRKTALTELAEADPRVHTDVMPTMIEAVRKDVSSSVRATAAEMIGRIGVVYPLAGMALEKAVETDTSPLVRNAAKQALWEYHLIGYRSTKGVDGFAGHTAEPPIAKPAAAHATRMAEPPLAASPTATVVPVVAALPPLIVDPLRTVAVLPGPRLTRLPGLYGPRTVLFGTAKPSHVNEPPLAKLSSPGFPPPTPTTEPPILSQWPEPVAVVVPHRFAHGLPPLVSPPDAVPLPEPTAEPPIGKAK